MYQYFVSFISLWIMPHSVCPFISCFHSLAIKNIVAVKCVCQFLCERFLLQYFFKHFIHVILYILSDDSNLQSLCIWVCCLCWISLRVCYFSEAWQFKILSLIFYIFNTLCFHSCNIIWKAKMSVVNSGNINPQTGLIMFSEGGGSSKV